MLSRSHRSRAASVNRQLRRLGMAAALVVVLCQPAAAQAGTPPREICVGSGPGCYANLQTALNKTHNGDVLRIQPGIFAGGVTITTTIAIIGAGSARTIISGGGPVITAGVLRPTRNPPSRSAA